MSAAVNDFAEQAAQADRWEIYWSAGIGTMQSPAEALLTETAALAHLLQEVSASAALMSRPGSIALASSAGAIYAGSKDLVISERTQPAPTTPYAYAKLAQEALLQDFALARPGIRALAARVSTVYGAGQASGKAQGLLTHIAQCVVKGVPVQIFVSLDTIRDYIAVDDAARGIVTVAQAEGGWRFLVKIVASERPTTISEIVSVFRRIARRPPRIVTSESRGTVLYSRKMQFRSVVQPNIAAACSVNLVVGVARVLEAERQRHAAVTAPHSFFAS